MKTCSKHSLSKISLDFHNLPYPSGRLIFASIKENFMTDSFSDLFLEAMRYEHWLRFYFLTDEQQDCAAVPPQSSPERELSIEKGSAILSVPKEAAERSRREEPALAEMLDALQNTPISMEHSRDIIFTWLGRKTGIAPGSAEFENRMNALAANESFRRSLDNFHGWVQELANNELDLKGNALPPGAPRNEYIPSFAEWNKAFLFWFIMQKPFDISMSTDIPAAEKN